MATAGYGMKFGKGYLGSGKQEEPMPHESEPENAGGDVEGQIHEHLQKMHAATGHGHSHIQHKGDGTHVAHHISHEGEVRGPEEHGDCPGGICESNEGYNPDEGGE